MGICKLYDVFTLINGADPDEMPFFFTFLLGLCCLFKYMFRSFTYTRIIYFSGCIIY